ncbi:hypothetical protein FSB78_04345 [Sphingomonas ginsenosidivorax]|uniref:DUF2889 domain-containing protein n=2 Tax=Sphingomonas ginsenosidivorax TaxID=862135 RepID=A0A5C6UKP9_9SPHN|nr:hypothetical protein FSB78_04345 [Sphingomonas ginsenosidivorax]
MGVTLHHDGACISRVESAMVRAPWSTCPGAVVQLAKTFTGVALEEAARRGEKTLNCTHLHDMTVIAAAHAHEANAMRYSITVSDAVAGERVAAIARDGVPLLRLVEQDGLLAEPAGKTLFELGDWIASLPTPMREAARLLRWAAIIAHGRAIPLERQSDATRMPANCFTFQPGRKDHAIRIGRIMDFSSDRTGPLHDPQA